MTKQKKLILDIVGSSYDHPTADEVFSSAKKQMPGIVLATVYNNLNRLAAEGKIRRISVSGEPDRFDRPDFRHDHIKCIRCGRISDVSTGGLLDELKRLTGVDIVSYELNMKYICDDCRKKQVNTAEDSAL